MRSVYLLAAVLWMPAAHATDLLCTGDLFLRVGQSTPHSTLMALDQAHGTLKIKTVNGWASGKLGTDEKTYMGHLVTSDGKSYWYNLDRYTGEAMWMLSGGSIVEFTGHCEQAIPRF